MTFAQSQLNTNTKDYSSSGHETVLVYVTTQFSKYSLTDSQNKHFFLM